MHGKGTIPCVCRECGTNFTALASNVKRGSGKYCSSACYSAVRGRITPVAILGDGTALIPLRAVDGSIRAYVIVDADKADWANQWRWCLNQGYAKRHVRVGGKRREIRLHRELLGLSHGDEREVDHRNRDRLDNRLANLRIVSPLENMQNKRSRTGSASSFRGVSRHGRDGKWQARITINGKTLSLGTFTDEHEAAEVALRARQRLMPYSVD